MSLGANGSRQRLTPGAPIAGIARWNTLDRIADRLIVSHSRQKVTLFGRTQNHERAAQIVGRLGQGDQIIAGRAANVGVGRCEIEALGLGQQPVQTNRAQTGVLDDRLELAPRAGLRSVMSGARVKGAISRPS